MTFNKRPFQRTIFSLNICLYMIMTVIVVIVNMCISSDIDAHLLA